MMIKKIAENINAMTICSTNIFDHRIETVFIFGEGLIKL
jgi:hypothetical protein